MVQYTDKQLIDLYHNSDDKNKAFGFIMQKYQQRLYWHIRRLVINHDDSDDVLQNTFLKAWKGLKNFRAESQLYTWLYRIATNESLTFLNQKRNKVFMPFIDVEKQLSETLESDEYFNGDQIQKKLQQAIMQLPEKQKVVFNMKYFEEMKYEEMSEILDTSVGALKASYHHAVKKIEKYFSED